MKLMMILLIILLIKIFMIHLNRADHFFAALPVALVVAPVFGLILKSFES
jgi:hypothetical protein